MSGSIQASPFHRRDRSLAGFVLSGRWPGSTSEWAQFLAVAVRLAAVPGMVSSTALFRAIEDVPDDPQPGAVGIITDEGPILKGAEPGKFALPQPPAIFVLHPPSENPHEHSENLRIASGCLLLPGIPHLGLEHRAAWVDAESDGTISRLLSSDDVDPLCDPDLAVLAALCEAA